MESRRCSFCQKDYMPRKKGSYLQCCDSCANRHQRSKNGVIRSENHAEHEKHAKDQSYLARGGNESARSQKVDRVLAKPPSLNWSSEVDRK